MPRDHDTTATNNAPVKILLIEDDDVEVLAIRRAFKKLCLNNELIVAEDGIVALDLLHGRNNREPLQRPFLIMLDWNMPRMNGEEFLLEIRNDPALKTTIVFVTTTSQADEDRLKAYDLGISGYIVKSLIAESFLDSVRMLSYYWSTVELPK